MGRRLVKKQKLTFARYNQMIDDLIATGMDEDSAMEQVDKEVFDSAKYELDMSDELNQKLMTKDPVERQILAASLDSLK